MNMAEQTNTPGVIEAVRAAAPVAGGTPAPAAPDAAPVAISAQPTGGQVPPQAPAQAQPAQPTDAVVTDNPRTKEQFEKLTDTNQRLAQTNDLLRQELQRLDATRQQSNQQFSSVQQVPPAQGQPSALPKVEDYIDIDANGNRFVNEAKFNKAIQDIYQKASKAEEVATTYVQAAQQNEVARQEREAFSAYPSLNPRGGQFDPRFSQQTRAIVYDSMINPQDYGGRPLGFKEAADFVQESTGGAKAAPQATIPTPTVNEANQVQKEQAAASAPSVPQQATANVDAEAEHQRQVMGTRLGIDDALVARLAQSPHRIEEFEGREEK
jgi:hypothetical protein